MLLFILIGSVCTICFVDLDLDEPESRPAQATATATANPFNIQLGCEAADDLVQLIDEVNIDELERDGEYLAHAITSTGDSRLDSQGQIVLAYMALFDQNDPFGSLYDVVSTLEDYQFICGQKGY